MYTYGTGQLSDAGNGEFYLLAGSHDEVAKLIDDDHDVGHVLVSLLGVELAVDELVVILTQVAYASCLEQVVAGVHLHTKRLEGLHHLGDVGDDGIFAVGELGQEVLLDGGVDAELHLLGIDHYELQLGGVLLIEERGDDGVQTY